MREFWEDQRRLAALQAIAGDERISQRKLAARLGVSLGLAHAVLRELESKGWVRRRLRSRTGRYNLTAAGRTAMGRLSLRVGLAAASLADALRAEMAGRLGQMKKGARVLLCGQGALADLAASAILNAGLRLVAVVSAEGKGRVAGLPVRPLNEAAEAECDAAVALREADARALRPHLPRQVRRLCLMVSSRAGEARRG